MSSLKILNKFPSSDYLPKSIICISITPLKKLSLTLLLEIKLLLIGLKHPIDILHYRKLKRNYLHKLNTQSAMKCTDINCKSFDHCDHIDTLYSQICYALRQSSIESVPSSKIHDIHDYIVPGFNKFAKELHCTARIAYIAWRDAGRPRSGDLCSDMSSSRLRFKYILRLFRQNEQAIRVNAHAKDLLENDMLSFWKGLKKENNSRLPLSTKINNCVQEENICKMWQIHYQTLLNSVKTTEHKERALIETDDHNRYCSTKVT